MIELSLPSSRWRPTRIHVSGDFFSQTYFDAWLQVAKNHPNRIFYGYTKALPFWVKRLEQIPPNFRLVASYGGTHDHLIKEYNLRYSKVVSSVEEAAALKLPIDHDDSLVYEGNKNFALLLHGTQPAGSVFAKTWRKLIKMGMGGYGKQKLTRIGAKAVSVKTGYFS